MYSIINNNVLEKFDPRDLDEYGRFVVPDGVTIIGESAFANELWDSNEIKNGLKAVILPDSVVEIEARAFVRNEGLKEIVFSQNLEKIGEIAFGHCNSLSYIELPDSLKTTDDEIFRDCKNLVGVKLPDKIEDIGRYIFEGSGIKRIGLFGKVIDDKDLIENIKTSYHFIQYAVENGKFIPKYNTVMDHTPKKEVPGFFKYSKLWQEVMKAYTEHWQDFIQEEYQETELPRHVRNDLYKVCLTLGLFQEGRKQKEVLQFIVKNMFEYSPEELHETFNYMQPSYLGYIPEFADFFIANYREPRIENGHKVRFLETAYGDEIDRFTSDVYNEWFFKIKAAYPNRTTLRHGADATINNSLTEEMVLDLFYNKMHYEITSIREGNEKLAEKSSIYGYSQEEFDELQNAFEEGKAIKPEDMILAIKPDKNTNGVVFNYLSKDDEEGAFLGEYTNCCQTAHELGRTCLFYGMSKPNSGFVKFTLDDQIIGQSWVWYNEKTGHVCLDNIEIPTRWKQDFKADKRLGQSFVECLRRLSHSIITGMNENGYNVNIVSIGAGCNDLKEIREFKCVPSSKRVLPEDYFGYTDADELVFVIDEHIKNNIQGRETTPEYTV